jgi:tRNA pseudouridine38/39 synthase
MAHSMDCPGECAAQVVALRVRSLARQGEASLEASEEMDYAVTLNRALPEDIRVLGWTPLPQGPEGFSARWDGLHRP